MLDIFDAIEKNESLFHFHENPNPECPVGKTIHAVLDKRLLSIQEAMHDQMKYISLQDLIDDMKCSVYLEKLSDAAFEKQILKGIGSASRTVGKLIGNIPVVKNGPVDEFLQDKGIRLRQSADSMEKDIVEAFAEISNPETSVFLEKMQDMIRIYNHTKEIYFDQKQIYLITD